MTPNGGQGTGDKGALTRRELAHYVACVVFALMGFAAGRFSAAEKLEVTTLDGRTHTLSVPGAPAAIDLSAQLADLEAAALGFDFTEPQDRGVRLPFQATQPGAVTQSGVCTPRPDGWIVCPVAPETRLEGEWH